MDDPNPYEAPITAPAAPPRPEVGRRRPPGRLLLAWLLVFVLNLPTPLLLGLSMTDLDARRGMAVAVVGLGMVGGGVCSGSRRLGMALVVGGAAVALSQFVPLLHIVAGLAGMAVGSAAGMVDPGAGGLGTALGVAGGLLVSLVTGSLLMAVAAALGLVLQVLTPGRWWGPAPGPGAPG